MSIIHGSTGEQTTVILNLLVDIPLSLELPGTPERNRSVHMQVYTNRCVHIYICAVYSNFKNYIVALH